MNLRMLASRRNVLQKLGLGLGAATLAGVVRAFPVSDGRIADLELAAAADRLIVHRHSAGVIGEYYLAIFESEKSAEALARQIRRSLPNDGRHIDAYTLLTRIRQDFERGEVVNLQGWLLSRTEARICALYAV